jgi:hypothetical protein
MSKRTDSGAALIRRWNIPVKQARYHKDGVWFMPLTRFPAALCSPHGYLIFPDEATYRESPELRIGPRINVCRPIDAFPAFVFQE